MSAPIERMGEMREQMYQSGRRPGSWRVSPDVWDAMRLSLVEWIPSPSVADASDWPSVAVSGYVYGLPATKDGSLPPNSIILEPTAR